MPGTGAFAAELPVPPDATPQTRFLAILVPGPGKNRDGSGVVDAGWPARCVRAGVCGVLWRGGGAGSGGGDGLPGGVPGVAGPGVAGAGGVVVGAGAGLAAHGVVLLADPVAGDGQGQFPVCGESFSLSFGPGSSGPVLPALVPVSRPGPSGPGTKSLMTAGAGGGRIGRPSVQRGMALCNEAGPACGTGAGRGARVTG
jgi:hypothetical protein